VRSSPGAGALEAAEAYYRQRSVKALHIQTERRGELVAGQEPTAIILGCSDSRVPAEIVFDQGLGDLFVIRVAGNVVAPSQIGSVEYVAERFGARLVVVLGHSRCSPVLATPEEFERLTESLSSNLRSIVEFIRPSVEGCSQRSPVKTRTCCWSGPFAPTYVLPQSICGTDSRFSSI
jgi:carbonic anhydrase